MHKVLVKQIRRITLLRCTNILILFNRFYTIIELLKSGFIDLIVGLLVYA